MARDLAQLGSRQRKPLDLWLPDAALEADHGWELVGTTVLRLRGRDGVSYIVKAGSAGDHHIARELAAHRRWLEPWTSTGRAPRLVHGDADAGLLVTDEIAALVRDKNDLDVGSPISDIMSTKADDRA